MREHACTLSSYVLYVHDPDQACLASSEPDSGESGSSGLRPKGSFGID